MLATFSQLLCRAKSRHLWNSHDCTPSEVSKRFDLLTSRSLSLQPPVYVAASIAAPFSTSVGRTENAAQERYVPPINLRRSNSKATWVAICLKVSRSVGKKSFFAVVSSDAARAI